MPGFQVSGLRTLSGHVCGAVCQHLQTPMMRPASPLFCQWSSPFPNLFLRLYPDYSLAHPTCMGADVALEQPGSGEGLATHLADAGQCVGADVHLEGTQAGILLVAVPAGEGGPSRQGAVQLLVPGQACQRMIGPVTVDALETAWGSRGSLGP